MWVRLISASTPSSRLDVSHGPDEFIDEAAMRRCAAVYALFAGEMFA